MDVEHLIDLVRKHVFLYDLSDKEYKNTGLKAAIWESIATELNQNVSDVKLKWKTVKDGYLKYRKQVKSSTGSGKKICDYVWKRKLMFLDKHNVTRKTTSEVFQEQQALAASASPQPVSPAVIGHTHIDTHFSLASTSYMPSTSLSWPNADGQQHMNDIDIIINYINEQKNYDAADHLFKSYAVSFKKLGCQQQAQIKVEMAKLFVNAELGLVYDIQPQNVQQPKAEKSSNTGHNQLPNTHTKLWENENQGTQTHTSGSFKEQKPESESEIPESKVLISRVYHYLTREYEGLKGLDVGTSDLSPLADVLSRTAEATGVSESTVTAILEEERIEEYVPKKRIKMHVDFSYTESTKNEAHPSISSQRLQLCPSISKNPTVYSTNLTEVKIEPPDDDQTQSCISVDPLRCDPNVKTEPAEDGNHYRIWS